MFWQHFWCWWLSRKIQESNRAAKNKIVILRKLHWQRNPKTGKECSIITQPLSFSSQLYLYREKIHNHCSAKRYYKTLFYLRLTQDGQKVWSTLLANIQAGRETHTRTYSMAREMIPWSSSSAICCKRCGPEIADVVSAFYAFQMGVFIADIIHSSIILYCLWWCG